jgi:hypothetical protein
VWQLQPIVAYANGTKNVAVTLFGAEPAPVRFHPAFVDKLLGLRLLQMDLLLDNYYVKTLDEMCGLPSFNGGDIILGPNERYDSDQCDKSMDAWVEIRSIINSKKSTYTSYIYTDFQQDIILDTLHGELTLSGEPYYRFTTTDTLRTYRKMQKAVDTLWGQLNKDWNTRTGEIQRYFPRIVSVSNLKQKKLTEGQKAKELFEILDKTRDYFKSLYKYDPSWQNKMLISESMGFLVKSDYEKIDGLLLLQIWDSVRVNKQLVDLTNTIKEYEKKDSIIYHLNPTVVNASKATCQWAAFFRYAKTKVGAKNWNSFVGQVKLLDYDAPLVYTPVKLIYDGQ